MKRILFFLLLNLFSLGVYSQDCGTQTSKRDFNSLARVAGRTASRGSSLTNVSYKEIPIVIHVLYDEGPVSVTDSEILSAVNDLNAKFNRAKFRFTLVSINRKSLQDFSWYDEYMSEPMTSNKLPSMQGRGASKLFDISRAVGVDPNTHLNIYVLWKIYNASGFSFIPAFGATSIDPSPKHPDGVWIRTGSFTKNSTAYNRNAVLIHEVGHYLGLFHTFNGAFSCENFGMDCSTTGDLVCDTPPFKQSGFSATCTPACNTQILPTDPWANYVFDNHMDYMSDNCRRNFTDGQIARMHSYISTNRRSVYREIGDFCLADLNQDKNVNNKDLLEYLACHGQPFTTASCYKCDFNGDGIVGISDQLFLLSMIGQQCE